MVSSSYCQYCTILESVVHQHHILSRHIVKVESVAHEHHIVKVNNGFYQIIVDALDEQKVRATKYLHFVTSPC